MPIRPVIAIVTLIAGFCAWPATLSAKYSADFVEQRFQPSMHPGDYFQVRRAFIPEHLNWSIHVRSDFASNTLVFRTTNGEKNFTDALITNKLTLQFGASLALFDFFDLALSFPVYPMQSGSSDSFLQQTVGKDIKRATIQSGGWGDLRILPKIRFVHPRWTGGRFSAALDLELTVPTGKSGALMGEGIPSFRPRLALDLDLGVFNAALNIGILIRQAKRLAYLDVGHELTLGLAMAGFVYKKNLELLGEMETATSLASFFSDVNQNYLEGRVGLRYTFDFGLGLQAGGGFGMLSGYGSPSWRALLGLGYMGRHVTHDVDGDGVPDDRDACPGVAEDRDGFGDQDGCPDLDHDSDNIPEPLDRCPNEAEDWDGFQDEDGCPDPDNDGDGIADTADTCPLQPESVNGIDDQDGCPEFDQDSDGIADHRDQCPQQPENYNGCADQDGCPEESRVCATSQKIIITDRIYFATGRATILPQSFSLLDEIAGVIAQNAQLRKIRIEGHTDDVGSDNRNLNLSYQRAQSVFQYLVKKGVEAQRLTFEGYGETQPLVPNDSDEHRAQNRRVEFIIVESP